MFTSRLTMCSYVDFGLSSITLSVNLTIKLYELSVFLDTCLNTYCHGIFFFSTNWLYLPIELQNIFRMHIKACDDRQSHKGFLF